MGKLGILFDIDKLDSPIYGSVAWETFWQEIGPDGLADGVRLHEGDTRATLHGRERIYCLAIESADDMLLAEIRGKLLSSAPYQALAGPVPFVDESDLATEPLVEVGHFREGQICGESAINARAALAKLRRTSAPPSAEMAPMDMPERQRPASKRSTDLPAAKDFESLLTVLGERFPGQGHSLRFSLTPEELCDVVERYDGPFHVYWHVGEATIAETATFVNLMTPEHAERLEIFGLMRFPWRIDVERYCQRESITLEEWDVAGTVARNFVGLRSTQRINEDWYQEHFAPKQISAEELWPRICARRAELDIVVRNRPWWRFWG